MFLAIHGTAGLAIGSRILNPWLSFVLGFFSHFILDAIPHDPKEVFNWVKKDKGKARFMFVGMIDLFTLIAIILFIVSSDIHTISRSAATGLIGAILPDLMWSGIDFFKLKKYRLAKWYYGFHERVHKSFYKPIFIPSIISTPLQIGTLILMIAIFVGKI